MIDAFVLVYTNREDVCVCVCVCVMYCVKSSQRTLRIAGE